MLTIPINNRFMMSEQACERRNTRRSPERLADAVAAATAASSRRRDAGSSVRVRLLPARARLARSVFLLDLPSNASICLFLYARARVFVANMRSITCIDAVFRAVLVFPDLLAC